MNQLKRDPGNPLLSASKESPWELMAAFNPSVANQGGLHHLVYRAQSGIADAAGGSMSLASIGYARSDDGVHFAGRRQIIEPQHRWERYGCEDPRLTLLEGRFYIFYTVCVRRTHLDGCIRESVADSQPLTPGMGIGVPTAKRLQLGDQRCGSSSSMRLAGCVGKRSSTSLK